MQWGKVKTVFILVFALVNIALFITYFNGPKSGVHISEETVSNTVTILKNNGIKIDKNLIPRKTKDVRIFDVSNKYSSSASLAKSVFGANATADDAGFEFVPVKQKPQQKLDAKEAKKIADKAIKDYKLEGNIYLKEKIFETDSEFKFFYYPFYDEKIVMDSYINIIISKSDGIQKITGKNYLFDQIIESGLSKTKPVTEILVKFSVTGGKALHDEIGAEVNITDLSLGYFIGDRGGEKRTVTASPAWCIVANNEKTYYYDARNGDLLN